MPAASRRRCKCSRGLSVAPEPLLWWSHNLISFLRVWWRAWLVLCNVCCFGVCSSAYQFYSREFSSKIRDELIAAGKESGMGDVVKIVAANWRSLPADEREVYETLHKADKKRYQEACDARDACFG